MSLFIITDVKGVGKVALSMSGTHRRWVYVGHQSVTKFESRDVAEAVKQNIATYRRVSRFNPGYLEVVEVPE